MGVFTAGAREHSGTRAEWAGRAAGVAAALEPPKSRGPSASSRRNSKGEGPGPRDRV